MIALPYAEENTMIC